MTKEVHAVVRTKTSGKTIVVRVVVALVVDRRAGTATCSGRTPEVRIDGRRSGGRPDLCRSARASPATCSEVLIEDEQIVKAGDVLVRLDPRDYEVAVEKAKADLADAVAALASSRTDVPITSVTTSSTLTGAKSGRGGRDCGIQRRAAAAWRSTSETCDRAGQRSRGRSELRQGRGRIVERYKLLVDKDEISKQQYDQAVAASEAARATLDAQKALVNEATQNISVGRGIHRTGSRAGGAGGCHGGRRDDRAAAGQGDGGEGAIGVGEGGPAAGPARAGRAESCNTPPSSRPSAA